MSQKGFCCCCNRQKSPWQPQPRSRGSSPSPAPPRLLRSVWNCILRIHIRIPVLPLPIPAAAAVGTARWLVGSDPVPVSGPGGEPPSTMVKLGCSFSGKPGKDPGDQDGASADSVPLISPLDVSQLQPPFPDQVVIKTQTEYQLSSPDQSKKFPDLEGQKPNCNHPEEGRRHKICTPLTLEMYYTEMDPERHRSILAAIGAYPLSRKHGTEMPAAWGDSYRAAKEVHKGPTQAGPPAVVATEQPEKPSTRGDKEEMQKTTASAPPTAPQ
ncbi:neuron-specific vesicular protein calcyon isoform X2 [Fukomys damarensis]|uniref:neuron-specific vesicular protein calcyon isoform X2 n=1 Tax=Fukomys damarensis TaxID=885580 RepID=UPI0014552713|nr:neuron-specific vesicular protein calcyon isoform X2 [Fukomys damarensis]